MNPPEVRDRCAAQLPEGFRNASEPVFAEPWQAQVFAMAVNLIESGVISWNDWSATLGDEISRAQEHGLAEDGSAYYELWLRALERLVVSSGLSSSQNLADLKVAWHEAYRETPHGQPVVLPSGH